MYSGSSSFLEKAPANNPAPIDSPSGDNIPFNKVLPKVSSPTFVPKTLVVVFLILSNTLSFFNWSE